MTGSAGAERGAERAVHPLVALDYPIRITGQMIFMGCIGSLLVARQAPALVAVPAVLQGLVWPHAAYLLAKRSRRSKRFELACLCADGFFFGAWSAYVHFNLWTSTLYFSALLLAFLSVGGVRLTAAAMAAAVAGALAVGAVVGFRFDPSGPPITAALCISGIVVYSALFGIMSHRQARGLVAGRRLSEQQRRHIEETNRLLALARDESAAAQRRAEEANRAKSMFLANMSHELRTPLNAIIGYSEMLQEEASELDPAQVDQDLRRISGAGKHLLGLINDVLDLSKIEAGKMDFVRETFDVAQVVREATGTAAGVVERNGNVLTVRVADDVGPIVGDATKVRQILLNLLSNAGKFTQGGEVTLTAEREGADGEGGWLVVRVADTGMGLSPEQQTRLFQAFTQVDATPTRKHGGTGLGLALSRRFARLMGGDIVVRSEPGKGSEFTLRLPTRPSEAALVDAVRDAQRDTHERAAYRGPRAGSGAAAAPATAPAAAPAPLTTAELMVKPVDRERLAALLRAYRPAANGRALVVDDDASTRDLLRRLLEREGWEVGEADSGLAALAAVREGVPDLVLLDLMMPQMDGVDFLATFRRVGAWHAVPVVVITARTLAEADGVAAERSGARLVPAAAPSASRARA